MNGRELKLAVAAARKLHEKPSIRPIKPRSEVIERCIRHTTSRGGKTTPYLYRVDVNDATRGVHHRKSFECLDEARAWRDSIRAMIKSRPRWCRA